MKRLTTRRRKWFRIRALNEKKKKRRFLINKRAVSGAPAGLKLRKWRSIVSIWQGEHVERAICLRPPLIPPRIMCFDENREETLRFFEQRRAALLGPGPSEKHRFVFRPRQPNKLPRIFGYVDFSELEQISTAASVILAAEYHRLAEMLREIPPTINIDLWNTDVFTTLFELGFFELLGLSKDLTGFIRDDGEKRTMRLISGRDATELELADQGLMHLGEFIDPEHSLPDEIAIPFLTGLAEAMSNVTRHAYPTDHSFHYRHVNRWWVTGTADRQNRKLTVVIYDQGATIPVTYSKKSLSQIIVEFLRKMLAPSTVFPFENDGVYIEAALRYGASQTGEPFRGKGLPQMIDTINAAGKGRLAIWSRGGCCVFESGSRFRRSASPLSIGGTLIEWTVELPS